MAKQYKRSDIAENDIFGGIAQSAENALKKVEAVDAQILKFSAHYKELLGASNTETLTGINQVLAVSEDLNKQSKETITLEKEKVKLQQLQVKLASDEAKAMQQTIKAQQQKIKSTKSLTVEQALLNEKQRQANEQSRAIAKFRGAEAGSLQQLEAKMKLIELAYTRLTPAQMENEKIGIRYLKSLQATRSELQAHQSLYGKYTLNVGNYKSAFDGLGMSVSQLAREMPAFANSMQTGFMAISNNLPIFFDEIQKIKRANAELVAQGEPVKSVFKQIGSAVFSWSSLLSVGVTLLTVFGTKIVDYVSTLFTAEKKTADYAKQQKFMNEQHKQSTEFIAKESAQMVGHLMKLAATNKGSKERSKLLKEINEKYGTHLKNLQDETLFQAQVNREVQRYIEYQKQRFRLQQFEEAIERNLKKQSDTKRTIAEQEKTILFYRTEQQKLIDADAAYGEGWAGVSDKLKTAEDRLRELNVDLTEADKRLRYYGYSMLQTEETIDSFGYTTEKATKKQKELNKEYKLADDQINDLVSSMQEYQKLVDEMALTEGEKGISQAIQTQIDAIASSGQYSLKTINDLIDAQQALRNVIIQRQFEEDKANAKNGVDLESAELKRQKALLEVQDWASEQKLEAQDKTNKAMEERERQFIDANKKAWEEESDRQKKELEKRKEFQDSMVEETLQEMKRISEEQEKMIDKQIEASQKLVDALQAQANAGNIQASQSIAQQQKVINEQIALKKKEQKEQQFLEETKLLYTAIENYVEKGDTIPVAGGKAFLQVKGVKAIAQSLQGFFLGTKRTVGEELGNPLLSGKDGYVVRVDGQEKILNPELSRATGNATTDEIVNGFLLSKSILSPMAINQSVVSDERLINEIQDLKHVIANKKELSIEADKLSDTLFQLAYKSKQGNNTTIDKYRYRS